MPRASSRRSSSSTCSDASGSAAVTIAVIGERRSWLTDRSSAVLMTSLRRSARVSTTSPSSSSRSCAAASNASSCGTDPLLRPPQRRPRAGRRAAAACRSARASSRSGNATRRSSPSTGRSSIAADGSRSAPARRCAATGRTRPEVLPAEQQARELRGEIGLAAALLGLLGRDGAPPRASELATSATTKKTASATQFSRVGDREAAGRRDVEEVERQRAGDRRDGAERRRPSRSTTIRTATR